MNKDDIVKFLDLDLKITLMKLVGYRGHRKYFTNIVKISSIEELDKLDINLYNLVGLNLIKDNLFCLDIENHEDSVCRFYDFAKENKVDLNKLIMEKTLHGGIHLYFKNSLNLKKESFWNDFAGIHYDIILKRAFVSPSYFKKLKYEWINDNFRNLKSKDNIPEIPEWLDFFLNNNHKYFNCK